MNTLFRHVLIGFLALLFTLFWSLCCYAASLGVQPLFLEVRPNQSAALRVSNNSEAQVSVEITVEKRVVDEDGNQSRVPADDDFVIFPPQGILKASSVQVFRLQPIIADSINSESYYVTVRQVPIDFSQLPSGSAQIQVVFAFDAAVHVVPRGSKPDPKLLSAAMGKMTIDVPTGEFQDASDGTQKEILRTKIIPAVELKLRNDGNKYLYLQDLEYEITGMNSDGSVATFPNWTREEILEAVNVVLVSPGSTRNIKLPLPQGFNASSLDVTIKPRLGS